MHGLLLKQIDYVFFLYGFVFIQFFSVCRSLRGQDAMRIPWHFLGLFGLFHGINEWLDMLVFSFGDGSFFAWTRAVFLTLSFAFLLEFGRLTCEQLRSFVIGKWIHIPLWIVIVLGGWHGVVGANVMIRYSFGFVGSVLASLALFQISKRDPQNRRALTFAAIAMLVYGAATGLIVPKTLFFPATTINDDSFLSFFHFPIQLLRGLMACTMAFSVWRYHRKIRVPQKDPLIMHQENWIAAGTVLVLIVVLVLGWFWVNESGAKESTAQQARLLSISQQAVSTVDAGAVLNLAGSSVDIGNPAYQTLKSQLQNLRSAITSLRFIYLMRKVNGKVILLVDSEPSGSKDESPPGQVYDEATVKLKEVFDSKKGIVDDPAADRWGDMGLSLRAFE